MNIGTFSLIIFNVILSATGQVLLKGGMNSPAVQMALGRGEWKPAALAVIVQPLICAGLAAYGASLLLWLAVLARVPLSAAYPFVALSISLTSIAGALFFNDTFSMVKLIGTMLILVGVVALSRG